MKKLYVSAMVAIILIGMFLTFKLGYRPAPIEIMEPSFFSQAEEIGAATYRKIQPVLQEHHLIVFGVPPQPAWNQDVVRGFVKAAAAENQPFEVLLIEPEMPDLDLSGLPPMEVKRVGMNTQTSAEFGDAYQAARSSGRRTLVYTASLFSTHLLVGNPITRFEHLTGEKVFTVTAAPLSLRNDQEFLIDPSCVGSERDMQGTADLGCAILAAGRSFYRQRIAQEQFVSVLQKDPEREDYLLLISYPGQDKAGSVEGNQAFRMKAPGVMGARGLPTRTDPDTLPAVRPTPPAM